MRVKNYITGSQVFGIDVVHTCCTLRGNEISIPRHEGGGSLQRSKETEGGDENKDRVLRERIQQEKGEAKGRIRKSRGKGRRWGKGLKKENGEEQLRDKL